MKYIAVFDLPEHYKMGCANDNRRRFNIISSDKLGGWVGQL